MRIAGQIRVESERGREGIRGFGANRQISPIQAGGARIARGALDVALHLVDQRGERIEFALFPDALDEFDLHLAAVEVAGEIQQMDLEQRRAVIDGRPDAETGDAG